MQYFLMKEKYKSLFENNGIFYNLLKHGNTQGEICKISKIYPDSSFQNLPQKKNMT